MNARAEFQHVTHILLYHRTSRSVAYKKTRHPYSNGNVLSRDMDGRPKWARMRYSRRPWNCLMVHKMAFCSGTYFTVPTEVYQTQRAHTWRTITHKSLTTKENSWCGMTNCWRKDTTWHKKYGTKSINPQEFWKTNALHESLAFQSARVFQCSTPQPQSHLRLGFCNANVSLPIY